MATVFALLFLVSFIVAIVGFVMMFVKRNQTDSKLYRNIGFCGLIGFVVFFILTGITAPDVSEDNKSSVETNTTASENDNESVEESESEVPVVSEESTEVVETTEDVTEKATEEATEETLPETEAESLAHITREKFNSELGEVEPTWYKSVRNDKTGNWRMLVVYTNKVMDGPLTIDYCDAYWEDESEVHFIVNLYLKTTTVIHKYGDVAYVTIHEYQDGEEHDAIKLAGGMVYSEFSVNLTTRDVEEIS